ncbi:hypothetical protein BS50DRAFT_302541 [Corynespora cassiicola Philippines]|uniref:Uncharacterized protein n=1 Tax=Corynespora cassiicola Philippines TaxID=1448308 RepID=A0A2T2NXK3_CORCC|nr:hypothetical protein BS50DRAFT_302541 [Corynespora cassiicola Philippines]
MRWMVFVNRKCSFSLPSLLFEGQGRERAKGSIGCLCFIFLLLHFYGIFFVRFPSDCWPRLECAKSDAYVWCLCPYMRVGSGCFEHVSKARRGRWRRRRRHRRRIQVTSSSSSKVFIPRSRYSPLLFPPVCLFFSPLLGGKYLFPLLKCFPFCVVLPLPRSGFHYWMDGGRGREFDMRASCIVIRSDGSGRRVASRRQVVRTARSVGASP